MTSCTFSQPGNSVYKLQDTKFGSNDRNAKFGSNDRNGKTSTKSKLQDKKVGYKPSRGDTKSKLHNTKFGSKDQQGKFGSKLHNKKFGSKDQQGKFGSKLHNWEFGSACVGSRVGPVATHSLDGRSGLAVDTVLICSDMLCTARDLPLPFSRAANQR